MPTRLRRLLTVRAPLCEWPGCGHRAAGCDQDHDVAWPYGPTCGCNLGPLCRRHHRLEQQHWTKARTAEGVRWTDPTGRSWLSPAQHEPAQAPLRPVAAVEQCAPHGLSDQHLAELLADDDLDPVQHELRELDIHPDDVEPAVDESGWGLALDDPHRWQPHAA